MTEINRNAAVSVGTSPTVIAEERNTIAQVRKVITIINTSTDASYIDITFTDEAGSGQGIRLWPGGFYTESMSEGFTPSNSRIMAIGSGAGATIQVQERLISPQDVR